MCDVEYHTSGRQRTLLIAVHTWTGIHFDTPHYHWTQNTASECRFTQHIRWSTSFTSGKCGCNFTGSVFANSAVMWVRFTFGLSECTLFIKLENMQCTMNLLWQQRKSLWQCNLLSFVLYLATFKLSALDNLSVRSNESEMLFMTLHST
jgi:hypothetical protein